MSIINFLAIAISGLKTPDSNGRVNLTHTT
jgi:hypothetical protein